MGVFIKGRPVPKVRMTTRSKWSERAQRCLAYQERVGVEVANALKQAGERLPYEGDVELRVKFYFKKSCRADLSNLIKSVEDGLQRGKVILNDRQVKFIQAGVYEGEDVEGVAVEIYGL